MAIKYNLPNESGTNINFTSEATYLTTLYNTKPRSSSGNVNFISLTSSINYTTVGTAYDGLGQEGLLLVLQDALKNYIPTAEDFNNKSDAIFPTAGGTATALTLTLPTLSNGYSTTFIASANNNSLATTLNIKPLYKPSTIIAPTLIAGKAYTVWYNLSGDCFFIKASAEGTATPAQVLATVPYSNQDDTGLIGEMPNNPSQTTTITTNGGTKVIPAGYCPSSTITASLTNFSASVIKAGTTVGGTLGIFTSDANAIPSQILSGLYAYVNGVKLTGAMPNLAGDSVALASSVSGTTLKLRPPTGFKDGVDDNVTITDANFAAENIKKDVSVLGKIGTLGYNEITLPLVAGTFAYVDTTGTSGIGTNSTTYVKIREFRMNNAGTIRVSFTFAGDDSGSGYCRVYKNGVGIGTEGYTGNTYQTVVQDFTVAANDLIQIYAKNPNGYQTYVDLVSLGVAGTTTTVYNFATRLL